MKYSEFGKYLSRLRLRRGLTMEQAAEALGYDNMGALNAFQRGQSTPPIEKLFEISRVYEEPIEDIIQELEKVDPIKARLFYELEEKYNRFFVRRLQRRPAPPAQQVPSAEPAQLFPGALPLQCDLVQDRISRKVYISLIIRHLIKKLWDLPTVLQWFFIRSPLPYLA